jgi:hypothetical protein
MVVYCDEECKEVGGLCDFCVYYKDEYEGTDKFSGEGKCTKKNIEVMAHDGCDDDFHCTLAVQTEDKPFFNGYEPTKFFNTDESLYKK